MFGTYAACYDLLYQDKDYDAECDYVLNLLKAHDPSAQSVLDLGCGTGRHAVRFAELGYRVTGLDRSREMLEIAQKASNAAGDIPVYFLHGDVRSFESDEQYDAIVSLFHVMSYQISDADVQATLQQAWAHLKPGGVLLFDFWHAPGVLSDPPEVRERTVEMNGHSVRRVCIPTMFPENDGVDIRITGELVNESDGKITPFDENHRMRYFSVPFLAEKAGEVGFNTVDSHGWLKETEPDASDWLAVIVLQKPKESRS